MSWNQLTYTSEQEIRNSLSDLATVASRTRDGKGKALGTAFPIAATADHILMLTARHVVEEGYYNSAHYSERKDARRLAHIPEPDNKPYESIARWVENTDELWCLLSDGNNLVQCIAAGVCLRPPLDMVFLVLDRPQLKEEIGIFQINTDILGIGEEIVITSLITKENVRSLVARMGKITAVDSKGALVDAPIYRTNIPIEAGASGGPVFKHTGDFNGTKEVVGVISSDFSKPEAFTNPEVDGDSCVSVICSAAPLQLRDTEGISNTFKDMCQRGFIKDVGSYIQHVDLTFRPDGNWRQKFPVVAGSELGERES